jgi:hypothetical protein
VADAESGEEAQGWSKEAVGEEELRRVGLSGERESTESNRIPASWIFRI